MPLWLTTESEWPFIFQLFCYSYHVLRYFPQCCIFVCVCVHACVRACMCVLACVGVYLFIYLFMCLFFQLICVCIERKLQYLLNRLQKVLNNAVCLIIKAPRTDHTTPDLHTLHWLLINARTKCKMFFLCFGAITSPGPGCCLPF